MAYFQTKNPNLGKFWRVLEWKIVIFSVVIWNILLPCGIFLLINVKFCGYLVYYYQFWYVLPRKIWQTRHKAVFSGARAMRPFEGE
jgi:hypothetical protein